MAWGEVSLVDRVTNRTWSELEVDRYLMRIAQTLPATLVDIFRQRNSANMTLLQVAVYQGNIPLLKVLLSFDVPLDGQTAEEYARRIAYENRHSVEYGHRLQVYALMKSRTGWRKQGMPFARSLRAIEEGVENIQGVQGHSGVLVFGGTGEGKSTFINYLLGVEYRIVEDDGINSAVKRNPLVVEPAVVGHTTSSQTLYPHAFKAHSGDFVYVDMPGFEDTRGSVEEIAAAAMTSLLFHQLRAVRTLCMVVSWNSLQESKMLHYRAAAENVGAMIGQDAKTAHNIVLIVTKPPSHIQASHVRVRLQKLADAENFAGMQGVGPAGDDQSKWALKRTTEAILARRDAGIIIADIAQNSARRTLEKVIGECWAQSAGLYNVEQHSPNIRVFEEILSNIMQRYSELKMASMKHSEQFQQVQSKIEAAQVKIEALEKEKSKSSEWLKSFDDTYYRQQMAETSQERQELARAAKDLSDQKLAQEQEYRRTQQELLMLEVRYPAGQAEVLGGPQGSLNDIINQILLPDKLIKLSASIEESRTKLWQNQDQLSEQDIKLAQIKADWSNAQARHEASAVIFHANLRTQDAQQNELRTLWTDLISQQERMQEEVMLSKLELEVNEDLFAKVATLGSMLNLGGKVKEEFMSLRFGAVKPKGASLPPSAYSLAFLQPESELTYRPTERQFLP